MSRQMIFARDPLGRRSLLIHRPSNEAPWILLASVSAGKDPGYDFEEVPTDFIYCFDLGQWIDLEKVCQIVVYIYRNIEIPKVPLSKWTRQREEAPFVGFPSIAMRDTP
jgi:hypothetical protein